MSDNFNDISEAIEIKNSIFSPESNIINYETSSFKFSIITSPSLIINNILFFNNFVTKLFKELLQELYVILLNMDFTNYDIDQLKEFMNNFLLEYDLDPKSILEIITNDSQNILCYSSLIGFFYHHGIGCEINKIKAFEIFSNSIKNINNQKNDTTSCNNDDGDIKKLNKIILQYFYFLFLYEDVISHRKNNYKLHIKNSEKGNNVSQYYVGNCYYYGIKIKRDYNKAFEWYSKSSKGGNIKAMYKLGFCYDYEYGVKKDEKKAFELYLKSAKGGYKDALYMVGRCYYYGQGVLNDETKAFEWYLKAARKGHAFSQYLVANYYNDGKFVSKNEEKGFYWNRKAAINDCTDAQYEMAEFYLSKAIIKNENKAFKWYLKLANKNGLRANYLVAKCYRDGIGTDKNLEEATKWFKKYESLKFLGIPTLNNFLNGSDINSSVIPIH